MFLKWGSSKLTGGQGSLIPVSPYFTQWSTGMGSGASSVPNHKQQGNRVQYHPVLSVHHNLYLFLCFFLLFWTLGQLPDVLKEGDGTEPWRVWELQASFRTEAFRIDEMFTLSLFSWFCKSLEPRKQGKSLSTCSFYLSDLSCPSLNVFTKIAGDVSLCTMCWHPGEFFFLARSFFIMNLCYVSAPFFFSLWFKNKTYKPYFSSWPSFLDLA